MALFITPKRRKIYVLRDPSAEKHGLMRIVDESGEDYLYPQALFRPIALPRSVKKAGLAARACCPPLLA